MLCYIRNRVKNTTAFFAFGGAKLVPSLDTYVHDRFKKIVMAIMSSRKAVTQALINIDKEARDNFLKAYGGKNPQRDIKFSYTFPQQKESFEARYVFELGPSTVVNTSLGGVESTYTHREKNLLKEEAVIKVHDPNPNQLSVQLDERIGRIVNIEEISFTPSDEMEMQDNLILFNRKGNEALINMSITVHYQSKFEKDVRGVKKGFTERASVLVIPISYNMDTARCLDAIAKVAIIMMRETAEEKDTFLLQEHSFEDMKSLIDPESDMLGFGRPFTLSYEVSNSIDFDFVDNLKQVILQERS